MASFFARNDLRTYSMRMLINKILTWKKKQKSISLYITLRTREFNGCQTFLSIPHMTSVGQACALEYISPNVQRGLCKGVIAAVSRLYIWARNLLHRTHIAVLLQVFAQYVSSPTVIRTGQWITWTFIIGSWGAISLGYSHGGVLMLAILACVYHT